MQEWLCCGAGCSQGGLQGGGISLECLFCMIAGRKSDAVIVYETKYVLAFLDINPVFKGHTLLIPKEHIESIFELKEGTALDSEIIKGLRVLGTALREALGCDGALISVNNIVSQEIPHIHFHIIPRRFKDGLRGFFWPRQRYESIAEMKEYGSKIKKAIEKGGQNTSL
ncbi:MAG: HIT family protein [Candidatus Micrarchaeaceae archaeon]